MYGENGRVMRTRPSSIGEEGDRLKMMAVAIVVVQLALLRPGSRPKLACVSLRLCQGRNRDSGSRWQRWRSESLQRTADSGRALELAGTSKPDGCSQCFLLAGAAVFGGLPAACCGLVRAKSNARPTVQDVGSVGLCTGAARQPQSCTTRDAKQEARIEQFSDGLLLTLQHSLT